MSSQESMAPSGEEPPTSDPAPVPTELPAGWRQSTRGDKLAVFAYGSHIELHIEPRYLRTRGNRDRDPHHFRVLLRKRFYARRFVGEPMPIGEVGTFEEAVALAHDYMAEFVEDRQEVAMETREELEADPVMQHEAEETIVTEAAIESAIEVAGYSEGLLVAELMGLLDGPLDTDEPVLRSVIHRDGTEYDAVYVSEADADWNRDRRLREFNRQFEWLNEEKLASTLDVGELTFMTASFEKVRMLRYLVGGDRETVILIDPEYPVHLPPFERQIAALVVEKWAAA